MTTPTTPPVQKAVPGTDPLHGQDPLTAGSLARLTWFLRAPHTHPAHDRTAARPVSRAVDRFGVRAAFWHDHPAHPGARDRPTVYATAS
jgi:hypothetical protein